jgi:flavin reductase (DIM6/NTAB) family NADH-FMN oxidoreductase RutF
MPLVDPEALRNTMRLWASGVSIVTTQFEEHRAGVTVSAFSSLSLEPPQIVICLSKDVRAVPLIFESRYFVVNILAAQQQHFSDVFGGRVPLPEGADRFDSVTVKVGVTGAPIIDPCLAYLECHVKSTHDGDTHWIIIGEVIATEVDETLTAPLVYFNRNYRGLDSVD